VRPRDLEIVLSRHNLLHIHAALLKARECAVNRVLIHDRAVFRGGFQRRGKTNHVPIYAVRQAEYVIRVCRLEWPRRRETGGRWRSPPVPTRSWNFGRRKIHGRLSKISANRRDEARRSRNGVFIGPSLDANSHNRLVGLREQTARDTEHGGVIQARENAAR
jgi:hypothetical protein